MVLYMLVTQDEYELPMIVEDTCVDLARKAEVTLATVHNSTSRRKLYGSKTRFVRVECEDDEDESEVQGIFDYSEE